MAVDIERMLRRVVGEVFGENVEVTYSQEPKSPQVHQARVTSVSGQTGPVTLRASYEWFEALIFDLDVSTMLYDYDDNEDEKEAALRELALVMRAYMCGEGHVEYKRSLLRRRERPVFTVVVNNREWKLGRYVSSAPYPG